MQPSTPPRAGGPTPSSADLPYGPLPVRSRRRTPELSGSTPLEQLVDLSWLEPEAAAGGGGGRGLGAGRGRGCVIGYVRHDVAHQRQGPKRTMTSTLASPPGRSASRARRSNGWSNADSSSVDRRTLPATVSKRSLVAALEERRRDVSHLTRATEIEQAGSGTTWFSRDSSQDPTSALRELLVPVLAPLLDEFVAVRTRAAVLESQLDSITARAEQEQQARRAAARARHERLVGP